MDLLFLGTGAGVPGRARNVSSLALKLLDELNEIWLFDCGEATQHQILRTSMKPRKITNIFITHLHGDHIFGLPGLLSSRSFQGGEDVLTVYGPPGIKQYLQTSLKISNTHLQYPLKIVELNPAGGKLLMSKQWVVDYLPLRHGILSFGFRITEPNRQGELLIDKLAPYDIPFGPIYGQIKNGETIVLEDGTVIEGKDFIAPEQKGNIITIMGDTRPTHNTNILAKDADILVHEATHSQSEAKMAHQYFHSTNVQAATIALENNVKQLYLNHISARYIGQEAKQLEKEAQAIFPNTTLVFDLNEFQH